MYKKFKVKSELKIGLYFMFVNIVSLSVYGQNLPSLDSNLVNKKPVSVFQLDANSTYTYNGGANSNENGSFTIKKVDQNVVITAETKVSTKSHYDIQANFKTDGDIQRGDYLLARFAIRSLYAKQESGDAIVYFFVQTATGSKDKSIIVDISAGPEWKVINLPFKALNTMKTGEGLISFSFGALAQKVEISNLEIINFKDKVAIEELPVTRLTYNGREKEAVWRSTALKRIEEIRTTPFQIRVVDKNGKPIQGATVEAKLTKSKFNWGTAVNERIIADSSPKSDQYKKVLKEFFNTAVIENGFKAGKWSGSPESRVETMKAFNWLETNSFRQRGHNLVWPAWKFNTKEFKELALKDTAAFSAFIKSDIEKKVELLKGRVIAWDVVNEMIHERDIFKYLPENAAVNWYKIVKKADPNAQLFMNEYGMLNSIASPKFIEEYISLIKKMKDEGAPIEAVGIQGHVGRQPRDPVLILSDLDKFTELNLPVQITEFDINMTDEELQGDYTRDFLIACYSHPIVTGFTNWGFWQNAHWKPDAAMFRKDWTIKPNGLAWKEWVTTKWKTEFQVKTDKQGTINQAGHLGTYEIEVTFGKVKKNIQYNLTKESEPLTVKL
jgi:GH35 family endo-1,4-beta-xylanase